MTKRERVQSVLEGKTADRPPVSFWHHFAAHETHGPAAVAAHVNHFQTYDLDFLKVMNDNGYPHATPIASVADLESIVALDGDEEEFRHQLDLLKDLRRALGPEALLTTTIFNAWTVLRHLIRPPTEHNPPDLEATHDVPSAKIKQFMAQDASIVTRALGRIATSLANFARRCIDAGADGIYLSVRDDWVDSPHLPNLYEQLVRETDKQILAAAWPAKLNVLHVCGKAMNLRAFAGYPHIHAINWADRSAGPSIAEAKGWIKPAIAGGVDNLKTLPDGSPEGIRAEVKDAIAQAGDRPIIVTPGCTYDPKRVPTGNLQALRAAVDN